MKQRHIMRYLTALLVTFMLATQALTVVNGNSADQREDQVEGSITSRGFNNALLFDAFRLYNTSLSSQPLVNAGTRLQPTFTYRLELDLIEYDGFLDIDAIEFRFYSTTRSNFTDAAVTNDVGNQFAFRWERNEDDPMSGFEIVVDSSEGVGSSLKDDTARSFVGATHEGITWQVLNSTLPAMNATEVAFRVEVEFRISKVAHEAIDQDEWTFGVIVNDGLEAIGEPVVNIVEGLNISEANPRDAASLFGMEWFGEVSLASQARVDWQNLRAGSDFTESANRSALTNQDRSSAESVTFIANGAYQRDIVSDPQWSMVGAPLPDGTTPPAILSHATDVALSTAPQRFGLRVNEGRDEASIVDGAVTLRDVPVKIAFDVNQTTEAGIENNYYFFISLSINFQNAVYTGKINFVIANYIPGS